MSKNCPLKTTALLKRICELLYGVHDSQSSNVVVAYDIVKRPPLTYNIDYDEAWALNFYEIMGCTKHVRHAIQCSLIGRNIVNHGCMYFYYDVLKVVSLFVLFMVMVCNMQTLLDAVLNPSIKLTALMQLFLPISIMFRFGNLNSIVAAYVVSCMVGPSFANYEMSVRTGGC